MRLHAPFEELLTSRSRLRVLRLLVSSPERSWTGSELARAAATSPPQAIEALRQLERIGLAQRATAGRAHLWHLTADHVLANPFRSLFSFEASLPERFVRELRAAMETLPLRRAILFGSVARGTETSESDVDLFLELNDTASEEGVQAALTPIVVRLIRRYGLVLSPILRSARAAGRPPNPDLMKTIEREGIPLVGEAP